jgi:pimeloyl-ACP methyl ester carboxylesterase
MAHQLADRRPDATLSILEGVGHYPMLEAPDRFAEAVTAGL